VNPLPAWFRRLCLIDEMIERGMYSRASGDCVCGVCGRIFYKHPQYYRSEDLDATTHWGGSWLTLLCDGTLVHL